MTATSLAMLADIFGHEVFRPYQEDIIDAVCRGEDAFVLMPTGGGKSLCYQVPALIRPGTAVVVSPLLALMKDQVDALRAKGVAAAAYNSLLDSDEARAILTRLHAGELDLLYVSPERLMLDGFLERLAGIPLALFAIDEAHCVSQWGHDFRPEYARLSVLAKRFPDVPRIALTATADPYTREDIVVQLGLQQAARFVAGFDRPNIRYSVRPKTGAKHLLTDFVEERRGQAGIVYCLSRKRTEEVAATLDHAGHSAAAYHAGLPTEKRRRVQEHFLTGRIDVVVATVAFGMGIDKANVRFVVHHDLPKSVEAYYQETGRAGRDGAPADALLMYSAADVVLVHRLIESGGEWDGERDAEQLRVDQHRLRAMVSIAEADSCRRRALLGYFGEERVEDCGNCDVCLDPPETYDATEDAQKILSCVFRMGQRFGAAYVVDVLMGGRGRRVIENRHDELSTHGIGQGQSRDHWMAVIRQLIHRGLLEQDLANWSVLVLTPGCKALLRGEERLLLSRPRERPAASSSRRGSGKRARKRRAAAVEVVDGEVTEEDEALFDRLRILRKRLADDKQVPAYVIATDRSLREMCSARPSGADELLAVHGLGPKKIEAYGAPFLAVLSGEDPDTLDLDPRAASMP